MFAMRLLPLVALSGWMSFDALRRIVPAVAAATGRSSSARLGDAVIVALGISLLTAGLSATEPVALAAFAIPGAFLTLFAFRRLVPVGTLRAARGYPSAVLLRIAGRVDGSVRPLLDWRGGLAAGVVAGIVIGLVRVGRR